MLSLATLKAIEMIVSKFPTYPAPLDRSLVDDSLEIIQALLAYALEPEMDEAGVMQWEALIQAVTDAEGV